MSSCKLQAGDRVRGIDFVGHLRGKTATVVGRNGTYADMVDVKWDDAPLAASQGWVESRFELIAPAYEPKVGDIVRVVLEGPVHSLPLSGGGKFKIGTAPRGRNIIYPDVDHVVSVELVKPAPKRWKAGDVIVVRFNANGYEYTYVRGARDWPGDGERLTDDQVNEKLARNLVRHVLRDGQPVCE